MKNIIRMVGVLLLFMAVVLGIESGVQIKPAQADAACSTTPIPSIAQLLSQTSQEQWQKYLEELTGEIPVMINGSLHTITNRYTPHLFDGSEDALAFLYIKEQLGKLQYPPNSEPDHYGYYEHQYTYNGNNWKNLVLTIPGLEQVDPHELILSTHLDDLPDKEAHGAEDNGVGVAALLEMARVLRYNQFNATIKLIWFTGEEQGRRGSTDYVRDNTSFFDDLIGVINLDMFGYDADDDGCFEIHAGNIPASYVLGDCLLNVIDAYDIPLAIDYIKEVVPSVNSDQLSFWMEDLGAIEILENHFSRISSFPYQQCGVVVDANPYTHTTHDTIENSLNLQHAFDIVKASLAASVTMAGPLGICFNEQPFLNGYSTTRNIVLSWQNMGNYATYRLSRSLNGCEGPWEELADNISDLKYNDTPPPASELAYQIEAIAPSGACRSLPSNCATNFALSTTFLPIISK